MTGVPANSTKRPPRPKGPAPFAALGRPTSRVGLQRYVSERRELALRQLWKSAPVAIEYLLNVVRGAVEYDAGRYKAAVTLLNRCVPNISAQLVDRQSFNTSANVNLAPEEIRELWKGALAEVAAHPERGMVAPVNTEFSIVAAAAASSPAIAEVPGDAVGPNDAPPLQMGPPGDKSERSSSSPPADVGAGPSSTVEPLAGGL